MGRFPIGVRRACGLLRFNRASSASREDREIRGRICELAPARPRFGFQRIHVVLKREGWIVNRKRVHRIYREEGLTVRLRRRQKRVSALRITPAAPSHGNERWSMDFVADSLLDGRRFRVLTVVDNYTRECPIIEVDGTLTGLRVVGALERVAKRTAYPKMITVDNGTEFTSKALDAWAYEHEVKLDSFDPGNPWKTQ